MTIIKHEPWECPRCKVINAPWVAHCTCRPEVKSKELESTINATIKICESESDHEWECIGMSTAGDTYRCKKCGEHRQYLLDGSMVSI